MLQLWFFANTLLWPINVQISGLALGLNVVVLLFCGTVWIGRNQRIAGYSAKAFFGLVAFMLFSYLVAISGPCTDKWQRFALTSPVFVFLAVIGSEIGWKARAADWLQLQKVAAWVLLLAFASFGFEAMFPGMFKKPDVYGLQKAFSGVFSEQSHAAFSLFPCLAILLSAESKQMRRIGLLALLSLLLLSRSTTLIGLIVMWGLYRLLVQGKRRWGAYFGLGILILLLVAAGIDYDLLLAPTVDRIGGVFMLEDEADTNLSSLLYLQGWQDAWANLQRTYGRGLGFNMMGCTPLPDVPERTFLADVLNLELNSDDGSFLFSKLVSEAGVIGVLGFIAIFWWWIRMERWIRKQTGDAEAAAISIQATLIFSFVATSLVRSAGYFSGGALLLVIAVAGLVRWYRHRARKAPSGVRTEHA